MILGSALLTASDAVTKWLTQEYPVSQVWCLRTLFVLVPIALLAPRYGGYRTLLPQMVSIVFSSPLFVAALAPLLLRERVRTSRWLTIIIGFIGVLVIVRPDPTTMGIASLIAIAAAFSSALRDIVTRRISTTESSLSILFCSTVFVIIIAFATAPWLGWIKVQAVGWALFLINGILNGGAHFLMIEALRLGEASAISPYKYTGLIWGVLLGLVVWGDVPSPWVIGGAILIAISGLSLLRNAQR